MTSTPLIPTTATSSAVTSSAATAAAPRPSGASVVTGGDTTGEATPTLRAFDNPPQVAARGTVIVVAGRGEHPGVYERFGTRIAADGYRVRVVGDPSRGEEAAATVTADVRSLLADPDLPAPRVLAGSDAGAAFAAALTATGAVDIDALLLVGLPTADSADSTGSADSADSADFGDSAPSDQARERGAAAPDGQGAPGWTAELEVRTACPAHQARLDADPEVRRGALERPVPAAWLADGDLAAVTVPVLGVHGTADLVSPLGRARARYAAAPRAELVTIEGGRHDALNDATHRSAAAAIVLFLERLRLGADLPTIARWA
ncbi:alpha/beta hydrolase [Frankia sp. AgPm24]|uniref:alpha/beta hydrolase n=1 Tax=Frankia sp. AgPm24 TaxID=631128 RepID=UPI00200F8678|nr:alpha/beta hydrolase [Frankia sp. AgPm24]MCK9923464.1 alpha/beta hydrolase [Frankia sp. AgPm24]